MKEKFIANSCIFDLKLERDHCVVTTLLESELIVFVSAIVRKLHHLHFSIQIKRWILWLHDLKTAACYDCQFHVGQPFGLQIFEQIVVDALLELVFLNRVVDLVDIIAKKVDGLLIGRILGQDEELHFLIQCQLFLFVRITHHALLSLAFWLILPFLEYSIKEGGALRALLSVREMVESRDEVFDLAFLRKIAIEQVADLRKYCLFGVVSFIHYVLDDLRSLLVELRDIDE